MRAVSGSAQLCGTHRAECTRGVLTAKDAAMRCVWCDAMHTASMLVNIQRAHFAMRVLSHHTGPINTAGNTRAQILDHHALLNS